MKILNTFIITILSLHLVSCHQNKNEIVKIQRFDSALIVLDTLKISEQVKKLYTDFPDFFPSYIEQVMEENPADTLKVTQEIRKFISDTLFQRVNRDVMTRFSNTDRYNKLLGYAYGILKNEFPEIKTPEIYFFVSGFNRSLIQGENFIGVGVDLFLGSDYPGYKEISYSYLTVAMKPQLIPVEILSQLLYEQSPAMNKDRLLEQMIYHGKIMYILSRLLPDNKPENIIAYTPEQITWCEKNEKEIWTLIVEQKHLFSTDLMLINKYINAAPFTTPVSQASPGRLGIWVGWQIVQSYMSKNRNITLKALLDNTDASAILETSSYKP